MGETRPWSSVGPGGLLGGPSPKRAHLATTRALCYKSPNPANPPQCGKPAKGVGPVAWSQRDFMKVLGGEVEPLGDELLEDQETVLSLSKKLSCTALCTARQQPSTTRQRSRQRASGQSVAKVQSSLSTALQPTGPQSNFAQVLNRG